VIKWPWEGQKQKENGTRPFYTTSEEGDTVVIHAQRKAKGWSSVWANRHAAAVSTYKMAECLNAETVN
jgi:hypothetical protein